MIQLLQRCGKLEPWTKEDVEIFAHIPFWLRSDYKMADRRDAEVMFCAVDAREEIPA